MNKALITTLATLAYAGPQGTRVAVTLQALHMGMSPSVVGLLNALSFILPMIVSIPAGRIVDRAGVRGPLYFCIALLGLAQLLALAAPSVWTLGFASAVAGIAYVGTTVALNVGVMRIGTPADRIANFSWLTIGISAGFGIGPMTAGFGIDAMGGSGVFGLLALFPLALAGAMAWRGAQLPDKAEGEVRSKVRLLEAVSDRKFRPVLLVSFVNPSLTDMFNFIVPLLAKQAGLSGSIVGTILGCYSTASFIARVALPLIVRRIKHWVAVSNLYIIAGLGLIAFAMVSEPLFYMALAIAIGLSHGMGQPLVMAEFVARSPPGRQGEVMGVQQVAQGGLSAASPVVVGSVGAAVGVAPVLVAAGALLLVASHFARRLQGR
ncbi:MAG: MFS transporter [Betaproteobacteria bacterium]|nr:MFS transporter [Betaproteobacteria bacterium]